MGPLDGTAARSRGPRVVPAPRLQTPSYDADVLVVHVLGPVRAEVGGEPVQIGSPKQRLLLAVLAARPTAASRSRLVDILWPDDPPPSAPATLLGYVSRLRGALGTFAIESLGDGYRLVADRVDAVEFEAALAPDAGVAELERGLALWDGEAFGELGAHPALLGEATRLHELRMDARLRLATQYIDAGDGARPVSMLEAIVADAPVREDAWVLLVHALLRAGRSAEAVRAASRCRRALAEIGLEPAPALVAAETVALASRADDGPARTVLANEAHVGGVRYARSAGAHLAYQVVGGGPVDLILSSYGSISIDSIWDNERFAQFVLRLATSGRVILYDTRGIGLSDPIDVNAPPSIDQQSDDLRAVVDAARATHPVIIAVGDGGPVAITYAAGHPDGLVGLVLVNTFARLVECADYPIGVPRDRFDSNLALSVDTDSQRDTSHVLRNHAPSVAGDAAFRRWWERAGRRGASPATAAALWQIRYGADVRSHLAHLTVPTLILHRDRSRVIPRAHGEYLAQHIAGARFLPIWGSDQPPSPGCCDRRMLVSDSAGGAGVVKVVGVPEASATGRNLAARP
jgi:DNA-binding SARP family transcriptional activator/pimeloyl-ACP methyl ester carboxylesterase